MNHFVADFNKIALEIGPLQIHWYALAYIAAFILGSAWLKIIAKKSPHEINPKQINDFFNWAIIGVIIGGRLGYVLFYQPSYYLAAPLEIFAVWQGGMAFHGGLIGVLAAMYLYCKKYNIPVLALMDLLACAAPIGLLLGRIANFINGELWGHPTNVAWAVIFPTIDNLPRHPSQLYEAALEGLLLFIITNLAVQFGSLKRLGLVSGLGFLFYGLFRILVEEFRVSDPVPIALENILAFGSWGQWLSMPMVLIGIAMVFLSGRKK